MSLGRGLFSDSYAAKFIDPERTSKHFFKASTDHLVGAAMKGRGRKSVEYLNGE